MDRQISPAVVVVVLILIVAIVVALYFMVVQATPQVVGDSGVMRPIGATKPDEEETEETTAEEAEAEGETPVAEDTEAGEPSPAE